MGPLDLLACGVVVAIALLLLAAAWAKRRTAPLAAAGELAAGLTVLALPAPAGAGLEGLLFAAFALHHARAWRAGAEGCGCFGEAPTRTGAVPTGLTFGAALLAVAAAVRDPARPVAFAGAHPGEALLVLLGAGAAATAWRAAFTGASLPAAPALDPIRLTEGAALWLERRTTRRTALSRVALVGSALAVAPIRYLLYPVSALAAVGPGDCAGGECTDGYTAFCCQITGGRNVCPADTFPGGWWMCTDYAGRELCSEEGVRYYVDCNALPGHPFPGGCRCAGDSCANQRVACNIFRYGQCNTQIEGTTAVVCRMVVCENPGQISGLNCSSSLAVDDSVCGQDTPCLAVPPARELGGAGGV